MTQNHLEANKKVCLLWLYISQRLRNMTNGGFQFIQESSNEYPRAKFEWPHINIYKAQLLDLIDAFGEEHDITYAFRRSLSFLLSDWGNFSEAEILRNTF